MKMEKVRVKVDGGNGPVVDQREELKGSIGVSNSEGELIAVISDTKARVRIPILWVDVKKKCYTFVYKIYFMYQ